MSYIVHFVNSNNAFHLSYVWFNTSRRETSRIERQKVMNSHTVMQAITAYIVENEPEIDVESIGNVKVVDVLVSSFEVLELVMELEEALGLEEEALEITELAPKFAQLTFDQLADEIAQYLNRHQAIMA